MNKPLRRAERPDLRVTDDAVQHGVLASSIDVFLSIRLTIEMIGIFRLYVVHLKVEITTKFGGEQAST